MQNTGPHTMDGVQRDALRQSPSASAAQRHAAALGRNPHTTRSGRASRLRRYWKSLDVKNFGRISHPGPHLRRMVRHDPPGDAGRLLWNEPTGATKRARRATSWSDRGATGRAKSGIDFGDHAHVDTHAIELRWFDHWLKGIDNGVDREPPVKIFVMGRNEWVTRRSIHWRARNNRPMYFTAEEGRIQAERRRAAVVGAARPSVEARTDIGTIPNNPVPQWEGTTVAARPHRPVLETSARSKTRSDVLVYTSDVLQDEIEVTGPVKVVLYASSDAVDTDFVAKLIDVYPDGRSTTWRKASCGRGIGKPQQAEPRWSRESLRIRDRCRGDEQCFPARATGSASTSQAAIFRSSIAIRTREKSLE